MDQQPRPPAGAPVANRTIPLDPAPPPPPPAARIRVVAPVAGDAPPAPERPRAVAVQDTRPPTLVQFAAHDEKSAARADVTVVIPAGVREALVSHAEESGRRQVEVGGFLVGKVERLSAMNPQSLEPEGQVGYLVTVTDVCRVKSKSASVSHVRFTEADWVQLNEECDRRFTPERKVRLGWYHTHPNQGIFYSDQDLNSHLEWRRAYQVGLVIDPRNMLCGLFHWRRYPAEPDAATIRDDLANPQLFYLRSSRSPVPAPRPEAPAAQARVVESLANEPALDVWGLATVASFLALLWGGLLFVSLHARTIGASPARFDPTTVLLGGLGVLFFLQRLYNAGVFRQEADPEPDTDFLWWRFLAVFGALLAGGYWLSRGAAVARATAAGVFAVGGLFLLMELWMGRVFHQLDAPEGRLCRRGLRAMAAGVVALSRLMFGRTVNALNVAGALVFGAAVLYLFWLVLGDGEDAGITLAGLLISGAIAFVGVLMCLAGEELRQWLAYRQQGPRWGEDRPNTP